MALSKILAVTFIVTLTNACNNYSLRDRPENPGTSEEKKFVSCGISCRIFVTANTYDGALGGIAGADQRCMNDPARPSSATAWKAMLVDGVTRRACQNSNCGVSGISEGVDWVLRPGVAYTRPDGTALGTANTEALFTFSLANSIGTATGNVWTGFHGSNLWTADQHCLGWSDNNMAGTGNTGNPQNTTNAALFSGAGQCSAGQWLYCVEQ